MSAAASTAGTPRAEHAHSVMHCNLNSADVARSEKFYGDLFNVRDRMRSLSQDTDGRFMGLSEHTASETVFMYDERGPRSAPALELVQWHDPALIARSDLDADAPSFRVIGFRMDSLTAFPGSGNVESVVVRGRSRKAIRTIDPDGVTVETVEIASADTDPGSPMLSHERLVVSDLERSVAWYSTIGFVVRPDDDDLTRSVPGVSLYLPEDPTFSFELECPPNQVEIDPIRQYARALPGRHCGRRRQGRPRRVGAGRACDARAGIRADARRADRRLHRSVPVRSRRACRRVGRPPADDRPAAPATGVMVRGTR
ncbi:hypothetical protein [Williamsia sp. DF01-3]|uniref:hypothetical protein n=1 Tax=Williamsia sp. DF01-3 TaxID=2934157 RepID=UPI001FF6D1A8|nr:hypothetical protein [Williamsia sp. DF01-3]MCK0516737.1 hypothetical protein [Williamsia sp. DF01-3]